MNVNEYMDPDEIREILANRIDKHLKDESELNRAISNCSYSIVYKMVDSVFGESLEKILSEKVTGLVQGLTEFSVFKKADAWDRPSNTAYKVLEKAVADNEQKINDRVATIIDNLDPSKLPGLDETGLSERLDDIIRDRLFGGKS